MDHLLVHPEYLSVVASKATEHMRKGYRHFDTQLGILQPGTCHDTAAADGTHAIILLPFNMDVDDELRHHASILCQHALNKQPKERLDETEEEVL